MSPGDFLNVLIRRWYVLVLALLLTAGGVYHVLRPTRLYQSTAVVVLKPPATGTQPNQLANLQPTLATDSVAVLQQMESPAGSAELRAAGVQGNYSLSPRNSGTTATPAYLIPSVQLQSELPDPARADAVVRELITSYVQHVAALQDAQDVPAAARMSVTVLVPPSAAEMYGTKSRGLVGVTLLGAVGGVLGALWADRWALRRRRPGTAAAGLTA
ncbi:hypothetical protein [Streptacidiphilus sp. P02-A3a]|uniref:hypothetical protein n=1 Tax=Streptacidiphilus sp. P02-A3a TaxID=2704468 RepID=UPI0015FBBA31|nr:hypothetical protein [Streptacidiphilus sp. P02-A3a]QMU71514.1 hypothetical protein GXP74_28050 [Streptacidiphilus sp. P02-A3a]